MKLGGIDRTKLDEREIAYLGEQLIRHFDDGELESARILNCIMYKQVFGMYAHVREQIRRIRSDGGRKNKKEKDALLERLMVLDGEIRDDMRRCEDIENELSTFDNAQNNDKEEA